MRAIMHQYVPYFPFLNFYRDIFEEWYVIQLMEYGLMILHIAVALSGTFVIIEGDTWGNHVDYREPAMTDRGFDDGLQLLLVAAERPGHEGGAPFERQSAAVKWRQFIGEAALG